MTMRVCESLNEYNDMLFENQLNNLLDNSLNEGLNFSKLKETISNIKNKTNLLQNLFIKYKNAASPIIKKSVLTALLLLQIGNATVANETINKFVTNSNKYNIESIEDLKKYSNQLVKQDNTQYIQPNINVDDKLDAPKLSDEELKSLKFVNKNIPFKVDTTLVSRLNKITPKRFSHHDNYLELYNKYDKEIEEAIKELLSNGEKPNSNLIKAIMMAETQMKPRKNRLGFEGFPQTKMKFVKWLNKKSGQNFNSSDLYNPKESAKLIHYFLKELKKFKHVNNDLEAAASYNWGVGNFKKHKEKNKKMPLETKNYVNLVQTMVNANKNS